MYLKISQSKPVLPLLDDDLLTEQAEQELLAKCPAINLHQIEHQQQVTNFLIALFAYYFGLPADSISPEHSIVDDIERQVWAKELEVDFKDVTYGRLFCGTDEKGNATGGLEDKGMMIAMFYMTDLANLLGIHEVDKATEATFRAEENEFASYYDCETINDLSTLIYSVCVKLQSMKLSR